MAQACIPFWVCVLFKNFISFLPSKPVFASSSSSSLFLASVVDLSFRRELLPLIALASKSDLWFCYRGKVLFSLSSIALGCCYKGFMSFLPSCNSRFQSSSYVLRCSWLNSSASAQASGKSNIIAMGSNDAIKGTSVQTLHSYFTSGASVPYLGC
jgi:hypothetical protein